MSLHVLANASELCSRELEERKSCPVDMTDVYDDICSVWPTRPGCPVMEPPAPSILAHKYYMSSMSNSVPPNRLNLLLISESHSTTPSDFIGLHLSDEHQQLGPDFGHLNLVHCMSYGETWLLKDQLPSLSSSSADKGTLTFWKLLQSLVPHDDQQSSVCPFCTMVDSEILAADVFDSLYKTDNSDQQQYKRVNLKRSILDELNRHGIGLIDVCPVSLNCGGGKNTMNVANKTTGKLYHTRKVFLTPTEKKKLIHKSWQCYSSVLVRYFRPKYIIILGKAVIDGISHESLSEVCNKSGSMYLGHTHHPSCSQASNNESHKLLMNALHKISSDIVFNDTADPTILPALYQRLHLIADERKMIKKRTASSDPDSDSSSSETAVENPSLVWKRYKSINNDHKYTTRSKATIVPATSRVSSLSDHAGALPDEHDNSLTSLTLSGHSQDSQSTIAVHHPQGNSQLNFMQLMIECTPVSSDVNYNQFKPNIYVKSLLHLKPPPT